MLVLYEDFTILFPYFVQFHIKIKLHKINSITSVRVNSEYGFITFLHALIYLYDTFSDSHVIRIDISLDKI